MDLSWVSMGIIAVIIFGALYLYKKDNNKAIEANLFGTFAVIAVLFTGAAWAGLLGPIGIASVATPYSAGTPGYTQSVPDGAGISTIIVNGEPRIIDSLAVFAMEADSGDWNATEDQVAWYDKGSDPRLPSSYALDTTTVAAGSGTDTTARLKTNTMYYGIFHDTSTAPNPTYYDGILGAGVYNPGSVPTTVAIKSPSTTDNEVHAIVEFGVDGTAPIWKIATIPGLLDETDITGKINDKTSEATIAGGLTSAQVRNSTNEIQIGLDSSPADGDTIFYNDTNGDGTYTLELTFGADGSDAFLKRPVLCFDNDRSNPCERDEYSKITAAPESGSTGTIAIPNDLTKYFEEMPSCVEFGGQTTDGVAYIGSGYKATYTLTFTVDETRTDGTADVYYMTVDDLGGYNAHDLITTGQGASSTSMTCSFGV